MAVEQGQTYLLFVSRPSGYELLERQGDAPSVGTIVELDGQSRWEVSRLGPSPLPQDRRACAYLQPAPG